MRSSFTLALIALVLGASSMARPMDANSDLAERDEFVDLETRMFDIEDLEARDYDFEDELVARARDAQPPRPLPPTPGGPGPRPLPPRPASPTPSPTRSPRPNPPNGPRPMKAKSRRALRRQLRRRAIYA